MSDKNLSQEVLQTIKNKKITIQPKWKFVIKNSLIWTASILSLILSSLAMAMVIYLLSNSDWDLSHRLAGGPLIFALKSMPYFWLLFLIILIILVYTNFKKTKQGYKYKLEIVILISLLASILLGFVFYGVGLAQEIEESFMEKIPIYRRFFNPRAMMWSRPRMGLLGGKILDMKSESEFKFRDFRNREWNVRGDDILMPGYKMIFSTGTRLKIIGEQIDENLFKAREIRPWGGSIKKLSN